MVGHTLVLRGIVSCGTKEHVNITSHASRVTRHTLHFTRHTSHVTCYTSRVTRHTSPGIYLFPVVGQGALVQAVAAAVAVEAKSDLRDV